jgi:hypothetical protein
MLIEQFEPKRNGSDPSSQCYAKAQQEKVCGLRIIIWSSKYGIVTHKMRRSGRLDEGVQMVDVLVSPQTSFTIDFTLDLSGRCTSG